MEPLPEPLTPADCDTRGLAFMPLDVVRLLDSDLFAISTGDEFKAAVALWCKSWNQVPAASLPDDDRILAHLSGTGRDWSQVKDVALHGWQLCSDGRWYHSVVAEKALEAMGRRTTHKNSVSGDAERKERERQARKKMIAELREAGHVVEWNIKTSALRDKWSQVFCDSHGPNNPEKGENQRKLNGVTSLSQNVTEPVTGLVMAKTGTGTGTSNNKPHLSKPAREKPAQAEPPGNLPKPNPRYIAVMKAANLTNFPNDIGAMIDEWDRDRIDFDWSVLPAIREAEKLNRERGGKQPYKIRYFDTFVREAHARRTREIEGFKQGASRVAQADEDAKTRKIAEANRTIEWAKTWEAEPDRTTGPPAEHVAAERAAAEQILRELCQ